MSVEVGDKITTIVGSAGTSKRVTVTRIALAKDFRQDQANPDEVAFEWREGNFGFSSGGGWDRLSTEGYEWAHGWEGPEVDALLTARALVPK